MELFVHHKSVPLTIKRFPGGESLIRIEDDKRHIHAGYEQVNAQISVAFKGNSDLIDMMLLADAVRRHYAPTNVNLALSLTYLPYARQDRVCAPGESLSIKVIADLINSVGFCRVFCTDIHSEVGAALINNLVHTPAMIAALPVARALPEAILVSPDAGANKKVFAFAAAHGYTDIVRADKSRDVRTGAITGTVVYSEHVGSRDFLVIDDICDGGRTFIELATVLRGLTKGKIYLYVTHGIFSAGVKVVTDAYDKVFVYNPMSEEARKCPDITVVGA